MKVINLLACVLLLGILFADGAKKTKWFQLEHYSFEEYATEFNKSYSIDEYVFRKHLFNQRLQEILRHNTDASKSWKQGVNQMSDWTPQEFRRMLGGWKLSSHKRLAKFEDETLVLDAKALPTSVDWRSKKIITAVKDQGMCGSCWTFGTAETIESYYALATGKLVVLSEQEILDCTPNPNDCGGTGGCGGGTPELAYAQIIKLGGLTSEASYPYISGGGQNYNCHFDNKTTVPIAKLSGFKVLTSNKYEAVLTAVALVGPLAINVDANAWSAYESGVFTGCDNSNPDINHVVQLVGYGTDAAYGDYWLVRNSWASSWGEDGYIRLQRSNPPPCGNDTNPSDGTGCNGGPSSVYVCGSCGLLYDVSYPVIST